MPLYLIIALILLSSGVTMLLLHLMFRSPRSASLRIREEKVRKLDTRRLIQSGIVNGLFSMGLVFGLSLGLERFLVQYAAPTPLQFMFELVGVLLVYDFLYYFLHRYPFHEWGYLKRVHTVHHKARYPIAVDSLYLHPVETFLGLALLFSCIALFGPVSVYSFAAILFVHSQLNITVHCGLDLPLLGYMSRKHDFHHINMRGGNFASITPLPDLVFGTAESTQ